MVLYIITNIRIVGSTFEVSEDTQYLEARRNPICHFGVSWCFCEFPLWLLVDSLALQVCSVPQGASWSQLWRVSVDTTSFFDSSPCGNHVISVPFFFRSRDYPVMNRTSIFTLFFFFVIGLFLMPVASQLEPVFVPFPQEEYGNVWRHFNCYNPEAEDLLSSSG